MCLNNIQITILNKCQDAVNAISFYARYINSDCKIKKDFAKFIGQSQKDDCNTNWISGADYLAVKAKTHIGKTFKINKSFSKVYYENNRTICKSA